jgi:glycosyltransferase involved in cell wall biosynthesis
MKKISIVLPNLASGGAERLAVSLANDWVNRGLEVEMALLSTNNEPFLELLDKRVLIIDLQVTKLRNAIFPLKDYFKNSKPDVIWSGLWPLTAISIFSWILSGRMGRIYTIDHNQLSIATVKTLKISRYIVKLITRLSYPFATGNMTVSEGVKNDLVNLTNLPKERIKVIYNPAARGIGKNTNLPPETKNDLWGGNPGKCIISIGSFKKQKNFKLLIESFALLSVEIKATLIILGEGPLREDLEKQVSDLNLSHLVYLPGFAKDPSPWLLTADLFVLSSDWEGLPTVLIEALDCGLPVVSTDSPTGPSEILEGGKWGILVPLNNSEELLKGIKESLNSNHDKNALMSRAEKFSVQNISTNYLQYFKLI